MPQQNAEFKFGGGFARGQYTFSNGRSSQTGKLLMVLKPSA